MKYLKLFEQTVNEPEIGDYVICEHEDEEINMKIQNNIGTIVGKENPDRFEISLYTVKYEFDLDDDSEDSVFGLDELDVYDEEILYWSKSKQDCEAYIEANKYNL